MVKRLQGIKRNFKNIAFIGPNPYLFLQHLPQEYEVEKFTFCEQSQPAVEKSYEIITERLEEGGVLSKVPNIPDEIIPMIIDEETKWAE